MSHADQVVARRLREIAKELDEMADGYIEKGAQLRDEATRSRMMAAVMEKSEGQR